MLNQSLLSRQLEDLINLELAESFNVNWSPLLVGLVVEVRVNCLDLVIPLKLEDLYT